MTPSSKSSGLGVSPICFDLPCPVSDVGVRTG
jgi:hypothetical protein